MREADARECARIRDTLELCLPIHEECTVAYGSHVTIRQEISHIEQSLAGNGGLPDCPMCGSWERPDVRLGDRWAVKCRACGFQTRGVVLREALEAWEDAAEEARGGEDTCVDEEEDRCPFPSA